MVNVNFIVNYSLMPDTNTQLPDKTTENPQPKNTKKIILVLIVVILLTTILISSALYIRKGRETNSEQTLQSDQQAQDSLEQDPFYTLTIPYLKNRTYQSTLGPQEQISENTNYKSYLTSYTSDGLKINGLLTIPTTEKPKEGYPAIVFVHGYIPPSVYTTTGNYVAYVDYLASQGFVVFKIDLRGHADSEGEASGAYYSGDYIVDTLNAYKALESADFVNPQAVGLWGHSMAGNVVLRSMAALPQIPAAVIWGGAVYTYTDMQKYGIDDNTYRPPTDTTNRQRKRNELRNLHQDFDPNNTFWKTVPATNYLSDVKGAIQLNHAVDDPVVNVGYSRDLNTLLDKTQIPHELHEYPTGGHNITDPSFSQAMQNTTDFFKQYLK